MANSLNYGVPLRGGVRLRATKIPVGTDVTPADWAEYLREQDIRVHDLATAMESAEEFAAVAASGTPPSVKERILLRQLRLGATHWNDWREDYSALESELDLSGMSLRGLDLSGANLSYVNLAGVDFDRTNLANANLSYAEIREIPQILSGNGYKPSIFGTSIMRNVKLQGVNLSGISLCGVDLTGADLQRTNLEGTLLHAATLTDVKLWRAQFAGWKIEKVVCSRVYWDMMAKEPTIYLDGEFEQLYSDQTYLELAYEGGITTFELSTCRRYFKR